MSTKTVYQIIDGPNTLGLINSFLNAFQPETQGTQVAFTMYWNPNRPDFQVTGAIKGIRYESGGPGSESYMLDIDFGKTLKLGRVSAYYNAKRRAGSFAA